MVSEQEERIIVKRETPKILSEMTYRDKHRLKESDGARIVMFDLHKAS